MYGILFQNTQFTLFLNFRLTSADDQIERFPGMEAAHEPESSSSIPSLKQHSNEELWFFLSSSWMSEGRKAQPEHLLIRSGLALLKRRDYDAT